MPKPETPFEAFLKDHLSALGPVSIRKMFGGAGVYADGVMFGLVADDRLYFKTDAGLRAALEEAGGEVFVWVRPSDGKRVDMGYVCPPETAMDDPEEAVDWARRALRIALEAKAAKPPKRPRNPKVKKP